MGLQIATNQKTAKAVFGCKNKQHLLVCFHCLKWLFNLRFIDSYEIYSRNKTEYDTNFR